MPTIGISDFRDHGVSLTSAAAPDFDVRANAILAGNAAAVLELKPYIAIVANRNPRTVVAYTVAWTAVLRNETSQINYTQLKFPDAVAGAHNGLSLLQGREMKTGDDRLVGMGFEVWPPDYAASYREFGLEAAERLGEVRNLEIALDAVIFDDGAMLGPDRSRLAENFIQFVHAKQTIYRDIVVGLESGEALEEVFAPLRAMLTQVRLSSGQRAAHQDPMAGYRRQAAAEILGFHNRIALEVFRRTLRREPFAIKKLSGTSD